MTAPTTYTIGEIAAALGVDERRARVILNLADPEINIFDDQPAETVSAVTVRAVIWRYPEHSTVAIRLARLLDGGAS